MSTLFLPYKLAVLLKEKGYDESTKFHNISSLYTKDGEHTFYTNYGIMLSGLSGGYINAPLYQQVIDWLETKGIFVDVWCSLWSEPQWWDWIIDVKEPQDTIMSGDDESYPDKYPALDAAIEKALNLIKS